MDEGLELKVDSETGLKTYIASENAGCETSAALVRRLFEKSIELGRRYHEGNVKKDLYEALRLLGTGLHCLEGTCFSFLKEMGILIPRLDFSAHSNYTELALRELGIDAFPHVGKQTEIDIRGKRVFPCVTGTFGMTDFLHSLVGELGDKVAQSEVEEMESKLTSASDNAEQNDQVSVLKDILDHVPWDMLGGDNKPDPAKADELKAAAAAKAQEAKQNPLGPNATLGGMNIEEAKATAEQTLKDMYPILEFHDQILQGVNQLISKVPGLDDLLENVSGALQIFIFSLLAPYVKPIIAQARIELKSSSQGILKSSEKGQYEVFENENSSDPTHSMLSKDHFSNVLNPVAGQVACATVRFVVPQIVESWSDSGKDVRQTVDNILQVFHHPALRDENREGQKAMFETVKNWWEGKDDSEKEHLKQILSFDGVKAGNNHEGEGAEGGHSHGARPKKEGGFVPSAQEGASVISDLASGLAGMVMQETGLSEKFGTGSGGGRQQGRRNDGNSSYSGGQSHQQSSESRPSRRNEESSYSQSESTSRHNNNSTENSHGRSETTPRRSDNDNEDSYGRSETISRRNENENSYSSSRRNDTEDTSSHGRQERSEYGRNEEPTSRRTQHTSKRDDTEENPYSSSRRYNNEESSYGSSRRDENEESSYGSSRRNQEESSYESGGNANGESGRQNTSSNYGRQQQSSYGRSEESSYSRGGDDEDTFGSRRGGNSYGRGGNDEDEPESRGQGGYGRQGWGRGNGGYGEDENAGY